jgi:hypothetical protein
VQWQYVLQSVVCVLGAVRRVTRRTAAKKALNLSKCTVKQQLKLCFVINAWENLEENLRWC